MNWAWASSLDHIWRSPSFPMWLTLAAAGFFAIIAAHHAVARRKSVANGALTVITLLAIGVAWRPPFAVSVRAAGNFARTGAAAGDGRLARLVLHRRSRRRDGAHGVREDAVRFGRIGCRGDSYAASQITRLTALGDVAAANRNLTPEMEALRRAIERDRYGLMAYVLVARDHCTPQACSAFRSLGNSRQVMINMDDRVYEGLVMRYSASWGAPVAMPSIAGTPSGALAALPPAGGPRRPASRPR